MNLADKLQNCHNIMRSGDLQTAEAQYLQLAKEHADNGDVLHLGALIARRIGNQMAALARIDAAIKTAPNHYEYHNTRGNICNALQDLPEAVKSYKASLLAKPDYLPAAQNLGKCLIDNQDPKQALAIYETALGIYADDEQLQIGRIIALKDMMRNDEALALLDAMANGGKYGFLRGQILLQMKNFDAAIIANEQALNDPVTQIPAFKNIMQIYWMKGDWQTALAKMDKYLSQLGHSDTAQALAVQLIDHADGHAAANELLDKSIKLYGAGPQLLDGKARMQLKAGHMEKAYEYAYNALSKKPGDLGLMSTFAEAALASGRANEAMHAANSALKILPNNQFWIAIRATAMRALGQDHTYFADTEKFVVPFELKPEGYSSLSEYNRDLKAVLDEMHGLSEHPLDQSLRFGTQTVEDLRFSNHPMLKAHFKALDEPIREYMKILGFDATHPFLRRNTGEYLITGSWSVKLRKAGFHVSHVHPQGWISSAYYVEVPEEVNDDKNKPGWIHFGKPPFDVKDKDGKLMDYERIIRPEPGILVLFPSYMWHGTNPLTKDQPRMTLPIDIVPI